MILLSDGPARSRATLLLAHGAGAPMDSPFMATLAAAIGANGIRVVRFEFPYMAARRVDGVRRPPDPMPRLLACWREVITAHGGGPRLIIGGKSMGGRAASLIADEVGARGLVCLGFPFHAPGKAAAQRIAHLGTLATPALIVQGTRDPMGTRDEVASYGLSPGIRMSWVEGGNHALEQPRAASPSPEDTWHRVATEVAAFVRACYRITPRR